MAEEKTLSSRLIYDGRAVRLRVDRVRTPSGRETTREIVEHGDCVAIIALDVEDNVLLVEQFRKPVEKPLLEIPAGGIEPGENPEDCVRRELREEAGFLPQKLERLGGFYSSPGYCSEYLHLYLATELVHSPLQAEDSESIKLVRVPLSEIPGLIASGAVCDAKSIAGLLTFLGYRKAAKLVWEPPPTEEVEVEVGYYLSAFLAAVYHQPVSALSYTLPLCQPVGGIYHVSDKG